MRFHFGAPPEDETFDPQTEEWLPMREPEPRALPLFATPVAIGLTLLWGVLCLLAFPRELFQPVIIPVSETVFRIQMPILRGILESSIWPFLTIFVLFVPVHEFIHALCFPEGGGSAKAFIGFWPATGFFYAHYKGPMSRNRL